MASAVAVVLGAVAGTPVDAAPPVAADPSVVVSGLAAPWALATDVDGNLYVTGFENEVVRVAPDGSLTPLAASGLSAPRGVAVDGDGTVYVADTGNDRVVKLPVGASQSTLPFTGLDAPYGVAVGGDGTVYVADTGNNRVVELPVGGSQSTVPFSGVDGTFGVAVDGAGAVYVADYGNDRVLKLPDGGAQSVVPFHGLDGPARVAVTARGDAFVIDYGNKRVVERTVGGAEFDVAFADLSDPNGLAVDGFGNVFVADWTLHEIYEVVPYEPFVSWEALVTKQYLDLTGSAPSSSALSTWVAKLSTTVASKGDLDEALRRGSDNTANVDPTARLYRAFLGRAPDVSGLKFWISRRRSGRWTLTKMADSFAGSTEFKAKYGTLTNRAFVTRIYTDVLGRTADPSGVNYWTGKLDAKTKTRGGVMVGFSESNEYKRKQAENTDVAVAYALLLGRRPTATEAADWVSRQQSGASTIGLVHELLQTSGYATHITG